MLVFYADAVGHRPFKKCKLDNKSDTGGRDSIELKILVSSVRFTPCPPTNSRAMSS